MNLLTEASSGGGMLLLLVYVVVIGGAMYFFAIRPQKKEQKRLNAMLSELEVGDSVIVITKDHIINEFSDILA